MINCGMERLVRQLMDLKLGYLKPLNIMKERKIINGGSPHLQLPRSRCPPSHQRRQSVRDAINPAAAGIGNPLNSLFAAAEFAAARQLNRARRRAPQTRYKDATIQPL